MLEDQCEVRIIHHSQVKSAKLDGLSDTLVEELSQLFKAISDPNRIRILRALEKYEMCVCDLAALLGVTESAVSHQLRLLRTLRLVKRRREGTILYYNLNDDHVRRLFEVGIEHIREL
jgi:DNA-binding transcriptional ArsR family regulator